MIVEGEFTFSGPRQTVWDLLQDPVVLAKVLPGAKRLEETADGEYEGVMNVGVGPVTAAEFSVTVQLKDRVEPERYTMDVRGKGPVGFTQGVVEVELIDAGDETTMNYRGDLQVGGRIAGVGQRLLDTTGKALTRQGLEAMQRQLEARLAPAPMAGSGAANGSVVARGGKPFLAWVVGAVLLLGGLFTLCGPT